MHDQDPPTVLVVDDERGIADGHAARLEDQYAVRTAYDGEEALRRLDEAVDVVLLDRRMPGLSGDEVLATLRSRDLACRVAMLTGVEPSFDIVDMGFDDYLCKPVSKRELLETVGRLHRCARYDERLQRYFRLASKVAVLETEHGTDALDGRREYEEMSAKLASLRQELDEALDELPSCDRYSIATRPAGRVGDYPDV